MKGSSVTSARATEAPPRTGRSSVRRPHTRTSADGFALSGRSDPPNPEFNAYRKDLADAALAGRVIASHYAEPVERHVAAGTTLRREPYDAAEGIAELQLGEKFLMLDDSLGWAWGYAGDEHRVGYVRSELLAKD